ncbi:preprotein translocase subunit SecG [Devosia sp. Naph2]|uniref:preprotein translocase subunit SecG n=1 Tax=Devosia polycyclovorans TaxID=3345148 RepID=UPI0035D0CB59
MANVLLVAYLLIVLALIVVILLQRSEGGALGIGGGGGGGGMMTARGSANLLTRTTSILAVLFFASAIGLTILNEIDRGTSSILDNATSLEDGSQPTTVLDALNALQGDETSDLLLPSEAQTPAATPETSGSDLPVPEVSTDTQETPAEPAGN